MSDLISAFKKTAERIVFSFEETVRQVRSTRPSASLLEDIRVDYAGARLLLKELASITQEGPRTLLITPWDKDASTLIEKAIREREGGLSVSQSGHTLRISLPPLSEETRRSLLKAVREKAEEVRIRLRQERDHVWKKIQDGVKASQIREDEKFRLKDKLDEEAHRASEKIAATEKQKEKEIME